MNQPNKGARIIFGLVALALALWLVVSFAWGWFFYDFPPNSVGYGQLALASVLLLLSLLVLLTKK